MAHDLRSARPAWMLNLSDNPDLANKGGNSVCCMESVSSILGDYHLKYCMSGVSCICICIYIYIYMHICICIYIFRSGSWE
jgi:hypothetical protein